MSSSQEIVITGLGACCAAGRNREEIWQNLQSGKVSNIRGAEDFFAPHSPSPLFQVAEENIIHLCPQDYYKSFLKKSLLSINRTIELALVACCQALVEAAIGPEQLKTLRVGISLGTTVGCTFHNEPYYINWKNKKEQELDPIYTYLSSNLSARIQHILQVQGPRAVITNACSSGTDAIGLAKTWLEQDLCDIVLAGGADEISKVACHGFSSLMLFSGKSCRPFDQNREGLNLGEGSGVIVLERKENCLQRKAKYLGYLHGYGGGCDGYHPTAPHPEGIGLQRAITMACKNSNITLDQISLINAHGTGTTVNDLAELIALQKLGLTETNCPPILSTKGATGHTLGAAGGVEAVMTLVALMQKQTVGTIGCHDPDPNFPLPVLQEKDFCDLKGQIGMSQSLAFGGSNSAIILEAA